VEVTVQDGVITNIDILEHKNGRGKSAEVVADRIMEEQKIDVDAVSGATNSSVVIKKAVENAYLMYKISLYMRFSFRSLFVSR
jgi:uncharacterized protein with FMN-binding domain